MKIKDFAGRLKFGGVRYNVVFDIDCDVSKSRYQEYESLSFNGFSIDNIRCYNDDFDRMDTPEGMTGEYLYWCFQVSIGNAVQEEADLDTLMNISDNTDLV